MPEKAGLLVVLRMSSDLPVIAWRVQLTQNYFISPSFIPRISHPDLISPFHVLLLYNIGIKKKETSKFNARYAAVLALGKQGHKTKPETSSRAHVPLLFFTLAFL